ncbi:MAG: asparagine synthase [Xanthomonadales bacterium]|nr:asparagine synthase [Xanthomonadales bacterium]
MTAMLAVVALAGTTSNPPDGFAAGIRSLGGFAPFGADEVDSDALRLWVARSFRGAGLAAADGRVLAIDGRLRDRAEFVQRHALASDASDAALILAAYAARGPALFESLDADIALLLVDAPARRVILFRDVLGERGLRYAVRGTQLQVSSRGSAIVAMRGETLVPNEVAMAHYFALRAPPDEVAWMQGVEELPAGGLLLFDDGQRRYRRFTPDLPTAPLRFGSDAEAAEAWREVVAGAVARACADTDRAAISLSSGIDSTLIAAFLDPGRACAVSWTTPKFPECDESVLAGATANLLGLPHRLVQGSDLLPDAHLHSWPIEPEAPYANVFRLLLQATWQAAAGCGANVLLNGCFGDELQVAPRHWPGSLVQERGWNALLRELASQRHERGTRALWADPGLRRCLLPQRRARPPKWVTAASRQQLRAGGAEGPWGLRLHRLYGREAAESGDLLRRFANSLGLELRYVYRDPALLRFAIALPAHYGHSLRGSKWLSREILRGRVPEAVRRGSRVGLLSPMFRTAIKRLDRAWVDSLLLRPDAVWPRHVAAPALRKILGLHSDSDQFMAWTVLSAEVWRLFHAEPDRALLRFPP